MTSQRKFDEVDRNRVVKEVQKTLQITLSPIGRYRKYFKGDDQKNYCIIGGYGDWHGLQGEFLLPLASGEKDRVLVIARVLRNRMELYAASMQELIRNKDRLVIAKNSTGSEYQFDVEYKYKDRASIQRIPSFYLKKIHEFEYDRENGDFVSHFKSLSDGQKREFLERLIANSKIKEKS